MDFEKLRAVLFSTSIDLLGPVDLVNSCLNYTDIPFEIIMPLPQEIMVGHGPCAELLSPSFEISGDHGKAHIKYTLTATLLEYIPGKPTVITWLFPKSLDAKISLDLIVYDPRLMTMLLNQSPRTLKTAIGAEPIEYDIQIGSLAMGSQDDFTFSYKMLVNDALASQGVRIRKVSFSLSEIQILGFGRCCIRDDDPNDYTHIPVTRRLRKDLVSYEKWHCFSYNNKKVPMRQKNNEKVVGLADITSDAIKLLKGGIYCSDIVKLQIPKRGDFIPTTPKPIIPEDDFSCKEYRPPLVRVFHTAKVVIEMQNAETITMESGLYLVSVGMKDCQRIMESEPDLLPRLDYEKVVGLEQWVPPYLYKEDILVHDHELTDILSYDQSEKEVSKKDVLVFSSTPKKQHVADPEIVEFLLEEALHETIF